ncbi:luciferin 4-monooxygenase-like isoform X2 [Leptidea sinapis]|uniref:luciferin 4-monooxygenase-like isoform X2 n=1 Tax=Leptidea sinapis TaxID=189913 RepID=UPI0021C357AF|nr:luciferin 4-monooxygenase-like isoform X2 [Leptidea sinapis]
MPDGATGEEESFASVASRSVKLAKYMRRCGLLPGDVLALGGKNHLDLMIPFMSALFNGLPILGVDPNFKYSEIKRLFQITSPKISFCDEDSYDIYAKVSQDLGLDIRIITFGSTNSLLSQLINDYDDHEPEENFQVSVIDVDTISPFLISTSGTVTDKMKVAAFKHQTVFDKLLDFSNYKKIDIKNYKLLHVSPINWVSGFGLVLGMPALGVCILQTSVPDNIDIIIEMINKYKPNNCFINPTIVSALLRRKDEVDLSCFITVICSGSKLHPDKLIELRSCLQEGTAITDAYGQTECLGAVAMPVQGTPVPLGSCGKCLPVYTIKLIDPDTGKEIKEASVTGEMCVKGPMFVGYVNDPEETAKSFTPDGYFKTGDLFYRDVNEFLYYVDRVKTVLKYRIYQILPSEIEDLIRTNDAVQDVCVLGVEDPDDGEHPVACIIKKGNRQVTSKEIKDLVAAKLSKNKQLRGGVLFLDELPTTSTGKVNRRKLQEIVLNAKRE